jgi:hypothetical protein
MSNFAVVYALIAGSLAYSGYGAVKLFQMARDEDWSSFAQRPKHPNRIKIFMQSGAGGLAHAYDEETGQEYIVCLADRPQDGMRAGDVIKKERWCKHDHLCSGLEVDGVFDAIYRPHVTAGLYDQPLSDRTDERRQQVEAYTGEKWLELKELYRKNSQIARAVRDKNKRE